MSLVNNYKELARFTRSLLDLITNPAHRSCSVLILLFVLTTLYITHARTEHVHIPCDFVTQKLVSSLSRRGSQEKTLRIELPTSMDNIHVDSRTSPFCVYQLALCECTN
jgi:hypothetical protein